ncbi:MAG: RNA-binding protein [Bacteroides xylanisolvens]
MKAISVKQPWAYLLCSGIKDIENRTWRLPEKMKGQRVLIQASGKWDERHRNMSSLFTKEQWNALDENAQRIMAGGVLPTSSIIGSVVFTDCKINHPSAWAEKTEVLADESGPPYYGNPIYNWVSSDPILFDKPILNVKGRLSFWDYLNIGCEPDENGKDTCCCQLGIDEQDQVLSYGNGDYRCKYCGGRWYK